MLSLSEGQMFLLNEMLKLMFISLEKGNYEEMMDMNVLNMVCSGIESDYLTWIDNGYNDD